MKAASASRPYRSRCEAVTRKETSQPGSAARRTTSSWSALRVAGGWWRRGGGGGVGWVGRKWWGGKWGGQWGGSGTSRAVSRPPWPQPQAAREARPLPAACHAMPPHASSATHAHAHASPCHATHAPVHHEAQKGAQQVRLRLVAPPEAQRHARRVDALLDQRRLLQGAAVAARESGCGPCLQARPGMRQVGRLASSCPCRLLVQRTCAPPRCTVTGGSTSGEPGSATSITGLLWPSTSGLRGRGGERWQVRVWGPQQHCGTAVVVPSSQASDAHSCTPFLTWGSCAGRTRAAAPPAGRPGSPAGWPPWRRALAQLPPLALSRRLSPSAAAWMLAL